MFKIFRSFFFSIVIYGVILYLVHFYSAGILADSSWFFVESSKYNIGFTFIVLALVFWLVNNVIKFVLNILTLPLKYITLGLFSLVLNMFMIYLFEYLVNNYDLGVFISLGTILQIFILSLFVSIISSLFKKIL